MANPTYFSGQDHAGFPKQMPKDGATELHKLDAIAVDPQGRLWVLYSKNVGSYILYYNIYDPESDSWAGKVEIYPDSIVGAVYAEYGSGSSQLVANRNGDMMAVFVNGTEAGSATIKVRVIRNDGTKESVSTVPDAGGNITNCAALAVNDCYDWSIVDNAGTPAGAGTYRVRAIDYNSMDLTWGNERFLYDSNLHGSYPVSSVYRGTASYSPIDDKVHVVTQVKPDLLQFTPWQLMYCADGLSPTFATLPTHLVSSTSYLSPLVQFASDNITAGRGYMTYVVNANTGGNETDFTDTVIFREIIDYAIQATQYVLYSHNHPVSGILGALAFVPVVDGHGNVHVMFERDGVLVEPTVYKFTRPAPSASPFGTSYLHRMRGSSLWNAVDDDSGDEVFFSDWSGPYSVYSQQRIAKPHPGHATMFVGAARANADGGSVSSEEGVWINFADVLDPAMDEEGAPVAAGCAGMEPTANDQAHRLFLFDEKSFSDAQDDVGVQ